MKKRVKVDRNPAPLQLFIKGLPTVALFEANLPNDHGGSGC